MTGIHDMGGVPGYGRVEPEENEPVFHSEWEGRVFGLVTTVRGGFSRKRLEALDPDVYLAGYYQRWMIAFEHGLLERGIVSEQELEAKTEHFRANPDAGATQLVDSQLTERVREGMYRQSQLRKSPPDPPAFVGWGQRSRSHHRARWPHPAAPICAGQAWHSAFCLRGLRLPRRHAGKGDRPPSAALLRPLRGTRALGRVGRAGVGPVHRHVRRLPRTLRISLCTAACIALGMCIRRSEQDGRAAAGSAQQEFSNPAGFGDEYPGGAGRSPAPARVGGWDIDVCSSETRTPLAWLKQCGN